MRQRREKRGGKKEGKRRKGRKEKRRWKEGRGGGKGKEGPSRIFLFFRQNNINGNGFFFLEALSHHKLF